MVDLGDVLERREQIRFGLRALVNFEWLDREHVRHQGQGLTRDISAKGLFIFSDNPPPAKVDIQVDVDFGLIAGMDTNLQLSARALVLRVELTTESGSPGGFAILNRCCSLANQDSMLGLDEHSRSAPN